MYLFIFYFCIRLSCIVTYIFNRTVISFHSFSTNSKKCLRAQFCIHSIILSFLYGLGSKMHCLVCEVTLFIAVFNKALTFFVITVE